MRAIGKRVIAFGLVNVPVKIYSATEDHDISLHQVHDKDGGRIRYQRRCEIDGDIVPYEHILKAYDAGDRTVVLTDEDMKSLPEERSNEIEVVEFVPDDQVDPIMFERSYFLEPDSKSAKAYVLLRKTLEETNRTAIVKFALRQKTRLGALRVRDGVLMLQGLLWADEVRTADFPSLSADVRITEKELEMSSKLVASYESDFSPEKFEDDYQAQLEQLIDAKLEQGDALDTEATFGEESEGAKGEVLDLMEALRRSVERNRSGGKTSSGKASGKTASRTSSSGKSTSSKSTSSKSTSSKSTGSRGGSRSGSGAKRERASSSKPRKKAG
ncbi:Ku protein [Humibacter albus]|jgi:DNA end-binding protein Ku|uniref:non-homologous end joining protein Ku n=1 Tax=Humibacter albus TaxID=427754 RepID=UPI0003B4900E|nr:Ku protein [Humibacter albus]